jgi:hypothetical protein
MISAHVLPPASPRPAAIPLGEPFRSAEQAWFWTMAALIARRDGTTRTASGTVRPCEPDDVVRCLDVLYRQRRIDLVHARVLRVWGERQIAPSGAHAAERCDARIWAEALSRLDWPLRVKGIVGKLSYEGN